MDIVGIRVENLCRDQDITKLALVHPACMDAFGECDPSLCPLPIDAVPRYIERTASVFWGVEGTRVSVGTGFHLVNFRPVFAGAVLSRLIPELGEDEHMMAVSKRVFRYFGISSEEEAEAEAEAEATTGKMDKKEAMRSLLDSVCDMTPQQAVLAVHCFVVGTLMFSEDRNDATKSFADFFRGIERRCVKMPSLVGFLVQHMMVVMAVGTGSMAVAAVIHSTLLGLCFDLFAEANAAFHFRQSKRFSFRAVSGCLLNLALVTGKIADLHSVLLADEEVAATLGDLAHSGSLNNFVFNDDFYGRSGRGKFAAACAAVMDVKATDYYLGPSQEVYRGVAVDTDFVQKVMDSLEAFLMMFAVPERLAGHFCSSVGLFQKTVTPKTIVNGVIEGIMHAFETEWFPVNGTWLDKPLTDVVVIPVFCSTVSNILKTELVGKLNEAKRDKWHVALHVMSAAFKVVAKQDIDIHPFVPQAGSTTTAFAHAPVSIFGLVETPQLCEKRQVQDVGGTDGLSRWTRGHGRRVAGRCRGGPEGFGRLCNAN